MAQQYRKNGHPLCDRVAMGTGVMLGARFLFRLAFAAGVVVAAFTALTSVRMSNYRPSAGGSGGTSGTGASGVALLMAQSIVVTGSGVARVFAMFIPRTQDRGRESWLATAVGGVLSFNQRPRKQARGNHHLTQDERHKPIS